jgi:hypothetical protein
LPKEESRRSYSNNVMRHYCRPVIQRRRKKKNKEKEKKQIDFDHTQEGIRHGHKAAGQDKGKQRDRKWRRDKGAE